MVILIADDNGDLLHYLCGKLRADGHTTLAAGDGEEAMKAIRAHPGPIDLVLTDMVMPRLSGLELCDYAAAERPGTKCVAMAAGTKGRELATQAGLPFLQKPFTLSALRSLIECNYPGEST